ncbi:O-acetyl-ADP-ribose deacetylase (regulator of RNase III) [Microbacterium sp. W4I4]|uniref:O-acetyl-ADP-ribose deacetylase n=1 Tax=Microbacterium sp. W4I4 TaxID=3042295 RepID=UPI0027841930|nr:O-acetyl-ADP-ribose deacetylase [Microbacterium sp. W4I4]MDQ0613032.1 O-acetyl-ADP-ribose deacetylase (regulator of RNase III) [Microbacterium sp. W4I4]
MVSITAVLGDITQQRVDAIVNAANRRMRGGGGVDGAIHRAGGPEVLADCIARFPAGLETGDAGYTTAGLLPATWVIHTVGPNHAAGEQDPDLLVSCYRRSLEVADELGARSVAFPLVSTGVYGWPLRDAVKIAVRTLASANTRVEEVRIVAFDEDLHDLVQSALTHRMATHLLASVRVLHERGYQTVRALPYMSPSGIYWRVEISDTPFFTDASARRSVGYSTAGGLEFAGSAVTATTSPETFADLILRALPGLVRADDRRYAAWYSELIDLVNEHDRLPVAFSDSYVQEPGWEIGWGSDVRFPEPPEAPTPRR